MSDLELTIGEQDFTVEIQMIDEGTNKALDLTPFNDIQLNIKTTDYTSIVLTTTLAIVGDPVDGLLAWSITPGQVPTPAGQFFGKIRLEQTGGGGVRKSRQFDIRVMRDLST